MKKILFGIILSLYSFIGSAQFASEKLKLGVQLGYNITNFRTSGENADDFPVDYSSKGGINANLYLKYRFGKVGGISIEPGVVSRGTEVDYSQGYLPEVKSTIKLSYFTLPTLLNFNIVKNFSVGAGAEASFLLNEKAEYGSGEVETDIYNGLDIAALVGIDISPLNFLDIAVRYSYGVVNLDEFTFTDNTGNEIGEIKLYNTSLQFSLRYNIIRLKD